MFCLVLAAFGRLRIRLLLLLCLIVASKLAANPRQFQVESWTISDGLPSSSVMGIAQTRDGFLWVGTNRGLARFDGTKFTVFTRKNLAGLRSEILGNMGSGPDSRVYMGTWTGGLSILDHGHVRTFGKAEGVRGTAVPVVLPVGIDEAWFGTNSGNLYHYRKASVTEVGRNALPRSPIYGLAMAPDGRLWIGSQKGLYYLDRNVIRPFQPKVPMPGDGVFDLAITHSGSIFASNDRGLFQIEGDRWRLRTTEDGLPSNRVQVLKATPGGDLWIGTDMGVAQLSNGRVHPINTPFCSAIALALDSEESLWIGCEKGSGLLRIRKPSLKTISNKGGVSSAGTNSLATDRAGTAWMATNHGLVRWRQNRWRLFTTGDGLPSDNTWVVSPAPDGGLWIGTENGFARMWRGRIEPFRTLPPGDDDPVISIAEDRSGNLWVGTARGLLRRRPGQKHLEDIPGITGIIWSIREDRKGNVWVATKSQGLIRMSSDSQITFTTDSGLASNMVYDTAEDGNGDIWVATEGGLSRIRDGKCASIRETNGLPAGRIAALECDFQGHLWLKTSSAVIAISIAEANRVADGGKTMAGIRFLSEEGSFGKPLESSNSHSMLSRSASEMWFATPKGVAIIDPAVLNAKVPVLEPQVDALATDLKEHDLTKPVLISSDDRRLQFSCTAPSLNFSKSTQYRYRLAGFDSGWRYMGTQKNAVYTSLPPGKYRFEVSVRRPFEPWSKASKPVEIRVLPHFYQTWWWYVLLILIFIAMVLAGYRFRLLAVRRQYRVLMTEHTRERSRLARELHDTLAQGMSGIHIQVEAAQVLLDADPQAIRKNLVNVECLAREASIKTRAAIAALRSNASETVALQDMLSDVAAGFRNVSEIPLAVSLPPTLPRLSPEVCHDIVGLVDEALANVHRHSTARQAHLTACICGTALLVEVLDEGKGFNPDEIKSAAGHFGIIGMKERASRVNGKLDVSSVVGEGTRVFLELSFRPKFTIKAPLQTIRSALRSFIPAFRVHHETRKANEYIRIIAAANKEN